MRNRVYELVLVQSRSIKITEDLKIPALLSVCRQIRKESLSIFYLGNRFRHTVLKCDTSLDTAFEGNLERIGREISIYSLSKDVEVSYHIRGVNWANLMDWCRKIYEKSSRGFEFGRKDKADTKVICAAHEIAYRACGSWESTLR